MTGVHRYWQGLTRPGQDWIGRVVRALHPTVHDWTDTDLPASVVGWLDARTEQVRPADRPRHRANLVRLWLLHEHGGVWLDHDVIPLRPLDTLPRPWAAAHGGLCNCAMGFDAHDPLLAEALVMVEDAPLIGEAPEAEVAGEEALWRLWRGRVPLVPLQYDAVGVPIPGADGWMVHLYSTSGS